MSILLFCMGIIYANAVEYVIHRYLFHGLGKKKNSVFSFHLRDHHVTARRNGFIDRKVSANQAIGLPILVASHLPVCAFAPAFFSALVIYAFAFVALHNYQHRNPEFTKKYFPWHWDHHMSNPSKSWGVVMPLMDWITGTLEKPLDSQR